MNPLSPSVMRIRKSSSTINQTASISSPLVIIIPGKLIRSYFQLDIFRQFGQSFRVDFYPFVGVCHFHKTEWQIVRRAVNYADFGNPQHSQHPQFLSSFVHHLSTSCVLPVHPKLKPVSDPSLTWVQRPSSRILTVNHHAPEGIVSSFLIVSSSGWQHSMALAPT